MSGSPFTRIASMEASFLMIFKNNIYLNKRFSASALCYWLLVISYRLKKGVKFMIKILIFQNFKIRSIRKPSLIFD